MNRICEVLVIFFSLPALTFSQHAGFNPIKSEAEFSSKMENYAAKLISIHSDFIQEKHLQYLDAALESKGQFWYKTPDKVRWEYTRPYKYILTMSNGKLKMVSESSNTEFDMKGNALFDQINDIMIASVSGNIFRNKDYQAQVLESSQYYLILMKPTSQVISSIISQMELYVDKNSYAVTKIKMCEAGSDYSVISFLNLKINENIDDSVFTP